jgi:N-acetylglutamate synthase-like GNAT family acetyltransferase
MAPQAPRIREAVEADAPAVRALIRNAQLNPRDLDWRRFLVADDAGEVVACAQVRPHRGGTQELASVAVVPAQRGRGIGRVIAEAAIAREPVRPLYLYTESRTEPFWAKLAFSTIEGDEIPRDMRGSLRIARVATAVFSLIKRERYRIAVMRRDER